MAGSIHVRNVLDRRGASWSTVRVNDVNANARHASTLYTVPFIVECKDAIVVPLYNYIELKLYYKLYYKLYPYTKSYRYADCI